MISTTILGIWGYSEIFIYNNFYCLQKWLCGRIEIFSMSGQRTSFTESYKIKQRLPHCLIIAPIFVYNNWVASYVRQPIYVGFSKFGSDITDITIEQKVSILPLTHFVNSRNFCNKYLRISPNT